MVRYNCGWKVNVQSIFHLLHPAQSFWDEENELEISESEESFSASKCNGLLKFVTLTY